MMINRWSKDINKDIKRICNEKLMSLMISELTQKNRTMRGKTKIRG
jgi:hypothetical protein